MEIGIDQIMKKAFQPKEENITVAGKPLMPFVEHLAEANCANLHLADHNDKMREDLEKLAAGI